MIYVTDDHHDSADYLARLLRRAGYPTRTFSSAAEVLAALNSNEPLPGLLVLDVMMPEMSGIECLREIRRTPATAKIPAVMYTADVSQERRQEAIAAGAQEYLVKAAVRWPQFLAVVQKQLGTGGSAQ